MTAHIRTVMITGAAGNLGRCVAASFHASGANLVLVDLQREILEKAFGAEDDRRLFAPTNLLEQEQVDGAVIRLTEAMAAELREKNINVNCVLPTVIDTPENRAAMPDADPARWVAPQDLAHAILFPASDEARAIHGAALPVTALS